jgi:integrase
VPRLHDTLTDQGLRALAPGSTPIEVRDGELRGLIVTVLPSGRKQFSVRYRVHGKQRRLVLGDYPGLTLALARKRARKAQTDIDGGRDLAAEHQAAKTARTDTVDALVIDYLAKHARKFKKTESADEDERIINKDVLPKWTGRSVRELTRRDVRALLDHVGARAPVMANRVLACVRKMLNFAVDHEWIDANPAARIKKPAPESSRERVLNDDEIRRVWRLLSNLPTTSDKPAPGRRRRSGTKDDPLCPISARLAALLKVRLLTAQRGGEVARMRWVDVDLKTGWWTIPGTDTKNGEPHRVPLTLQTVAIISSMQLATDADDDDDEEKPGRAFVFVGYGASIRDRAKKAPAALVRVLGFEFRGHDFRRTAATRMAAAGIPREHISRVLNHIEGGPRATKVYDRYSYDNEKRVALETWARVLNSILEQKSGGAVVPFTGRK